MTIDVTTPDDDDEPFPITGTGNDTDWRVSVPPRRDLLSYTQARSKWKCSDADLGGWVNSNRVLAYELKNGRIYRFSWLEFPVGDGWQSRLIKLKYKSVSSMADRLRYLSYAKAIALIKKAAPERDAAADLADAAGLTDNELQSDLLAISLTGESLTAESLKRSIYIKEQVEDFARLFPVVRKVYDREQTLQMREEILRLRQSGMPVDDIQALGYARGQITGVNKKHNIKPLTPGTKPRIAG